MTDPSREPAGTPGTTGAPASAGPSGSSGSNGSGGSTRRPALQPVDVLRQMPLRRRAAQVVMPRVAGAFLPDGSAEHELLAHWVADLGVGGVLVGMGPPLEIAARLNTLQSLAAVPLLVGADLEHGPGRILQGGVVLPYLLENGGGTRFPPLMGVAATGDEAFARELGRITAIESRAVGIHVAFAPVADVNSNPRNPIINTRSYGADPRVVARFVAAHVRGLQDHGMIATAKHFPGHGDTSSDSHLVLPFVAAGEARLQEVELVPFRAAVDAGVMAIMSGHIAFPAITGDDLPATVHPQLLRRLLRDGLGFDGLVFSDALDMGAIARQWGSARAAVMALNAGIDVVVQMPPEDVASCVDAIARAVEDGTLDAARLDEAVLRVLRAKQHLGLFGGAAVSLRAVSASVGVPAHTRVAAEAADRAVVLLRDTAGVLPLGSKRVLVVIHTEAFDPLAGSAFVTALQQSGCQADVLRVDASVRDVAGVLRRRAADADVVLLASFTRVAPGVDAVAVDDELVRAANDVARERTLAVVSFGSPYAVAHFPDAACHVVAWAGWEPMQGAAARVLAGRVAATARLPIPVPPLYDAGAPAAALRTPA